MKTRNRGFTLLELMVVLVIAGVLLGIGVPGMRSFILNGRMTAAANDLMAALHLARSEAIKRRVPVVVCTSTNALVAAPTCANSATLSGWFVFVDANRNGVRDNTTTFNDIDGDGHQDIAEVDLNGDGWKATDPGEDADGDGHQDVAEPSVATEPILLQHPALPATISAKATVNPLQVTYLETGFTQGTSAGGILLCDSRGNVPASGAFSAARGITISATGRAGVSRETSQIANLITAVGGTVGGCGG
jgi:prepilin-type N-terminal cleavage/methylation domain-containing protein